ncbi:hypothetical protein HNQ94_001123 [Salirhabdus euzebyi]|uniref:PRC-barrel domain-containing protein n=1 Tax=Salirhabdus euzebyi TaxID=394506 RepID=A0A841PUJ6_9BACI|nr:PRC-barrel domain-containing protein [Salirhabdus euzebyi]MBB6452677.1 hypothetical protein [Salirhabdus euzebyi]
MDDGSLNVLASKETIQNAPNQKEDEPISKQAEEELESYYGWPNYWGGLGPWGGFASPLEFMDVHSNGLKEEPPNEYEANYHLRSAKDIKDDPIGFTVEATDEQVGNIYDFVVSEDSWEIKYIVVETQKVLPTRYVLLATDKVTELNWAEKKVYVNQTADEVKQGEDIELNFSSTK